MDETIEGFQFPPLVGIRRIGHNHVLQLLIPLATRPVVRTVYAPSPDTAHILTCLDAERERILVVTDGEPAISDDVEFLLDGTATLHHGGPRQFRWIKHPLLNVYLTQSDDLHEYAKGVAPSWQAINPMYRPAESDAVSLRPPQYGGLFAVMSHWTTSRTAATVVMPTGTGKTDTMIALLLTERCPRLLVLVPTDALREQLANQFATLGILPEALRLESLPTKPEYPVVGVLQRTPQSESDLRDYLRSCNVVVTTMALVSGWRKPLLEVLAREFSHVFIDEAHHIAAKSWGAVRDALSQRPIVQFTATPFRNDGKALGGKIVYVYPMLRALEEGYFSRIQFRAVFELELGAADQQIAVAAVEQLRSDIVNGYDHVLMARVSSKRRAKEIFKLYSEHTELNPVELHSGITPSQRRKALTQLRNGASRIVICVDMLGEGFDLPQLKIAAFHDVRKSMPITLQVAGRFVRTKGSTLGTPTFIANIADPATKPELRRLYSDDPDWNEILIDASSSNIQKQESLQQLMQGFHMPNNDVPLTRLRPALSTVVYRTHGATWSPENFHKGVPCFDECEYSQHAINYDRNVLIAITARRVVPDWSPSSEVSSLVWALYIVYWDSERSLLFIHASENDGFYRRLAESVIGVTDLVAGDETFRCMGGIDFLRLQNAGLTEHLGGMISYRAVAGSHVDPGLSTAEKQAAAKSNVFGVGFERGQPTSMGCSRRGRIWSRKSETVDDLIAWCGQVGDRILDESINPDTVLAGTATSSIVSTAPDKSAICVDWPDDFYADGLHEFILNSLTTSVSLCLCSMVLRSYSPTTGLEASIHTPDERIDIIMRWHASPGSIDVELQGEAVHRGFSVRRRNSEQNLREFLVDHPPLIRFSDLSSLEGRLFITSKLNIEPFDRNRFEVWDWTGINRRKESAHSDKPGQSIHEHVMKVVGDRMSYDLMVVDDGPHETADIVAVAMSGDQLGIDLFHCKYSSSDSAGARVEDLYEVCGQAQKSVLLHRTGAAGILRALWERESARVGVKARLSPEERRLLLDAMWKCEKTPTNVRITIVQPGVSKAKCSDAQLSLFAATEMYLLGTYRIPLSIVTDA